MKRNPETRLAKKRKEFIDRTTRLYPDIDLSLFNGKPALSIRVNTIKSTRQYDNPLSWAPDCYQGELNRNEMTQLPEFTNGEVYLQNPSSYIPPLVLDPQPGEKILDLCAAPGGKASHIAALAQNDIELWVNDNSKPRLLRMKKNFDRLGVEVHSETMYAVDRVNRELPAEYFDKILLDAPCSGEGALSLDDAKSLEYWSVAQIKRLQKLQRQAIITAWQLLKPGGVLVYSTCTMAPDENESVIDWLLRKQEDSDMEEIHLQIPERTEPITKWSNKEYDQRVTKSLRIRPTHKMEAFFVARLTKRGN